MKHPFSQTIANLKWLEEQDFPLEIWEMITPKVDELNMSIEKFKIMSSSRKDCWAKNKDLYDDKFLNKEIEELENDK